MKLTLARREDQVFREQVGAFLRITPLAGLPSHPPEFRQQALRDLRAAQKAGLLAAGGIDPQALAQRGGPFARFADPQALLDAEWQAIDFVIEALREANYGALAHFLSLRPHGEMPVLVVAVRYFFRRELENDAQLSSALSFAQMERLAQMQEAGYDGLGVAITKSGAKLETLMEGALAVLAEMNAVVTETHGDVKDIKAALDRHGQHLEAVGHAVFRALSNQAQPGGARRRTGTQVRGHPPGSAQRSAEDAAPPAGRSVAGASGAGGQGPKVLCAAGGLVLRQGRGARPQGDVHHHAVVVHLHGTPRRRVGPAE